MDTAETRGTLTVALMAAFADGMNDEREREAVKRVVDTLGADAGVDLPVLYAQVLASKPDLGLVAGTLQSAESKQLAYEVAVGICEADGSRGPAESEFLSRLAAALRLPATVTDHVHEAADALSQQATTSEPAAPSAPAAKPDATSPTVGTVLGKSSMSDADMDEMIRKASITIAAIELLPESIATMAINPLQMRLVYRIGRSYGFPMDTSNAKDFLATLGVGLTGQYLEQFGRKLLGGLLGGIGGGLGRTIGRQAASSGMSFATTYAIGRVAQRYYASGRSIDAAGLKQAFASMLEEARSLAPRYQQQITQAARGLDARSLASLIRQV